MHDYKKALAKAVKDARTKQGLSQERLAEILNLDSRTILNIEAGRGNPKFEILVALITYLKIPTNNIFYPESDNPNQNFQKLLAVLYDCSDLEIGLVPHFHGKLLFIHRKICFCSLNIRLHPTDTLL